jgi:TonB family protein
MVQSCQVCRDNGAAAAAARAATPRPAQTPAADGDADGGLRPLLASVPDYPENARGARGHVDVELTVNAAGQVESSRVVAAEPAGVFDRAALAAVSRWRYPAQTDRSPQTITERLEFRPPERAAVALAAEEAPALAGTPRNQCVRESAVYNYGDMVDVGLMNACDEPIVVYGCAQGTGRYVDRWLCSTSEEQSSVLVPPNDARIGNRVSLSSPEGLSTYTYADSLTVTRAPNSQYWWVACAATDAACRSGARQWSRAMAGQPAAIDPEARSPVAVARSH